MNSHLWRALLALGFALFLAIILDWGQRTARLPSDDPLEREAAGIFKASIVPILWLGIFLACVMGISWFIEGLRLSPWLHV